MDFSRRSYQKELLDMDTHPYDAILRNMKELNTINTYLGGHHVTLNGLQQLVGDDKEITICEIGCGGGDNLAAIDKWCKKKKIQATFIGIDINPHCIEIAKTLFEGSNSWFIVSDYKLVRFKNQKIDILFSSLFCHHFTYPEIGEMLTWMQTHAQRGYFINDLHRHPFAYYSIRMLTSVFSKSPLVKNDGPLSVLRGFSRREWEYLMESNQVMRYTIAWKWAFRWLIVVKKSSNART
jgi:SAM-dependent methyltransferase